MINALALLKKCSPVDFEQLLAFQYSKLVNVGDIVVDIGAHTGLHSERLAWLVGSSGQVIIVEPLPSVVDNYLRPAFEVLPNCEIVNAAVADETGSGSFWVAVGSEQESGLRRKSAYAQLPAKDGHAISSRLITLDQVVGGRKPSFIKIDVEGAELLVLRGGRNTLATARPILVLESSADAAGDYGLKPSDLFEFVQAHSYEVASPFGRLLAVDEFTALAASGVIWDFFLLPQERAEGLAEALMSTESPRFTSQWFVDLRAPRSVFPLEGMFGFSWLESWGRWTDARISSEAHLQFATPLPKRFRLDLTAMGIGVGGNRFDVVIGDRRRTLTVQTGKMTRVSAEFELSSEQSVLTFVPYGTRSPSLGSGNGDVRILGIGLQSVRLVELT